MSRTGLDKRLATRMLSRLGDRPASILTGVMLGTFALSMFMSNTATTVLMLAILGPLMASFGDDEPFGRALLMGIAVAANIGGMASLIGTPPNAIVVGALGQLDPAVRVDFLGWMLIAAPVAVLVLVLARLLLTRLYPTDLQRVDLPAIDETPRPDAPAWKGGVMKLVLALTVGLWMTSQWHGIPTAAVSLIPIVLLTTTSVLSAQDMRGLPYDVLFLLAGGLALGDVVVSTGLSAWIVDGLPIENLGLTGITLAICYLTVLLSNLMSNTAAANILVPLGMAMAVGSEPRIALPIAMSASAAMCLPIATPPNALVYANGRLATRDLVRLGLVVGLITPPLAVACIALWY